MEYAVLPKSGYDKFISFLAKQKKLVAPVYKGNNHYAFEPVTNAEQISLSYIPTILPPKKYFMPQYETLVEYDTHEGQNMQAVVELEDLILFGVHTCDIAGIQCLNMVFIDRPRDLNYLIRKNHIIIIGFECNNYCDSDASCGLMDTYNPNGGYDLFLTDLGDYFLVHISTHAGEELVVKSKAFEDVKPNHFEDLKALRKKKEGIFKPEVPVNRDDIPKMFEEGFDCEVWEEIGNRCLSCANCTNVCPTCYCFDVKDIPNLDLKTGKRIRIWDSCQNEPFAKVAGGESFCEKRKDRKRHRFNRKFNYPVKRYSRFFCTGCGRCTRVCMAEINLKETIVALAEQTGYIKKSAKQEVK